MVPSSPPTALPWVTHVKRLQRFEGMLLKGVVPRSSPAAMPWVTHVKCLQRFEGMLLKGGHDPSMQLWMVNAFSALEVSH